jgi:hypothetical protein
MLIKLTERSDIGGIAVRVGDNIALMLSEGAVTGGGCTVSGILLITEVARGVYLDSDGNIYVECCGEIRYAHNGTVNRIGDIEVRTSLADGRAAEVGENRLVYSEDGSLCEIGGTRIVRSPITGKPCAIGSLKLEYYTFVKRPDPLGTRDEGENPYLDAIERLNGLLMRFGECEIRRMPRTGAIISVADTEVRTNPMTERLLSVGNTAIEYFADGNLMAIGNDRAEYSYATGRLSRLGKWRIEYSPVSGKITYIG